MDTIVVGVDFSEGSELAVQHAINLARIDGAEVVLVHIGDEPQHGPGRGEISEVLEDLAKAEQARSLEQLDKLRDPLSETGVRVTCRMESGFPDTALCEVAKELDARVLVVGTHGFTGFRRVLLGSVAERVVRLAEVPVLVARKEAPESYLNIVVPTDFTQRCESALERACELVAPAGRIELLHCWQMPAGYSGVANPVDERSPDLYASIAAGVQAEGARLVAKHGDKTSATVEFRAEEAPAIRGIQERIDSTDCDLVIMGSHGRRGFRRFLLGSVAEATVRHVSTSVLVLHNPAD